MYTLFLTRLQFYIYIYKIEGENVKIFPTVSYAI